MMININLQFAILATVLWIDVISNELPSSASELFTTVIKQTGIQATGDCSKPKESDIQFLLYTRSNTNTAVKLSRTNPFVNPKIKVILLIHGWFGSETCYRFPELKNKYLKRYNCNVIIVDWSKLAWLLYPTSVCYLPKLAEIVADFLCVLNRLLKVDLNKVHLVGHSLGAQMSGLVGQNLLSTFNLKLGRITGLDPAGPLYQDLPISERLDQTDANFVDVIHTNQGVLGYVGDCGDVDFYVNCGTIQPGCPVVDIDRVTKLPMSVLSCDHFRSVEYMTESINSNNFRAKACKDCTMDCHSDVKLGIEIFMGEECPRTAKGAYVVTTNPQSPFSQESTIPIK